MRSLFWIICFWLIVFGAGKFPSEATPPANLSLEYDLEGQNLLVSMDHITHDPREHRIRLIIVTTEGGEEEKFFYAAQSSPTVHSVKLPLKASAGDRISVKALCSEAGYAMEELTVKDKLKQIEE